MRAAREPAPPERDAALQKLVEGMHSKGLVTAAVALVGGPRGVERFGAAGRTRGEGGQGVRPSTLFDLASLTKPFTATLALALDATGSLPLGTRLGEVWGNAAGAELADRTLESLLRHRSGLAPWAPLYAHCRGRQQAARFVVGGSALGERRELYGDLDFLLWAWSAESALGTSYPSLLRRFVLAPLGLGAAGFSPGERSTVVECRLGNERERELAAQQGIELDAEAAVRIGTVQDGNARFLGGIAGHAGLFASARQVWRLASEWLAPGRVLRAGSVERALSGGRLFTLGWVRRTVRGSAGPALSPAAFGHVGFTGGSVWIEPEPGTVLVLLAHRTSSDVDLKPWRRRFHKLVLGGRRAGAKPRAGAKAGTKRKRGGPR